MLNTMSACGTINLFKINEMLRKILYLAGKKKQGKEIKDSMTASL